MGLERGERRDQRHHESSADTQGGLVDAKVGDFVQRGAGRWGGKLAGLGHWRGYALGYGEGHTDLAGGSGAMDDWRGKQAGFRTDLSALRSTFTVQGDIYENIIDTPGGRRSGGNLLGRWNKPLAGGGSLQVQAYYDQQDRSDTARRRRRVRRTGPHADVQAEHVFTIGSRHQIVWGAGQRSWIDRFVNTANPFVLVPESETLSLTNIFGQDTMPCATT